MPSIYLKNLLGQRFGSRTAIKYVGNKKWLTSCDCGAEFITDGSDLRRRSYVCNHIQIERFFAKVDKSDTCWLWTGSISKDGYGNFKANSTVLAHIYSWTLVNGLVPIGLELDHLCRNRSCVNPAHLEPVTHKENVRRGNLGKVTKERFAKSRNKKAVDIT